MFLEKGLGAAVGQCCGCFIAALAELGGKGGGGRRDLAQGGGADAANAAAAVAAVEKLLGA